MEQKEQAPGTRSEHVGANTQIQGKYTTFTLGYHQARVYDLLCRGGHYSAADISATLRLSDPRSAIRDLRDKGVPIVDVWCDSEHGGRFKRYFIRKAAIQDGATASIRRRVSDITTRYAHAVDCADRATAANVSRAVWCRLCGQELPTLTDRARRIFEEYGRPYVEAIRDTLNAGGLPNNAGKEVRNE